MTTPQLHHRLGHDLVYTYKAAIEKDIGFDFNKTLHRALVVHEPLSSALFGPLTTAVEEDAFSLSEQKIISKDTAELVKLKKAVSGIILTPEGVKLIELIRQCNKIYNNTCNAYRLTEQLLTNDKEAKAAAYPKADGSVAVASPDDSQFMLEGYLGRKYNVARSSGLCGAQIITTDLPPNIASCGLIKVEGSTNNRSASKIDIDESKYENAARYQKLVQQLIR